MFHPSAPPPPPPAPTAWQAVVFGPTQSGKTWRALEVLAERLGPAPPTHARLILFVAQSNSSVAASQMRQRLRASEWAERCTIIGSAGTPRTRLAPGSTAILVDYWNRRNTDQWVLWAANSGAREVILLVDEADQGGEGGTFARLRFCGTIQALVPTLHVLFVTATIANLSKSIGRVLAKPEQCDELAPAFLARLQAPHFDTYSTERHADYKGAQWFVDHGTVRLIQWNKDAELHEREASMVHEVARLPDANKRLVLVAVGHRKEDHDRVALALVQEDVGFNVVVKLNSGEGAATTKGTFDVVYRTDAGVSRTWAVPLRRSDVGGQTLPEGLCAALRMGTTEAPPHPTESKFAAHAAELLRTRPSDFPKAPRIAMVGGHLMGRGITFQAPAVGWVCTAFVFTHTGDTKQCGAPDAQRFGRANLIAAYPDQELPILLTTSTILANALANEKMVKDRSMGPDAMAPVALAAFAPEAEFKTSRKAAMAALRAAHGNTNANGNGEDAKPEKPARARATPIRFIEGPMRGEGEQETPIWFTDAPQEVVLDAMPFPATDAAPRTKSTFRAALAKHLGVGRLQLAYDAERRADFDRGRFLTHMNYATDACAWQDANTDRVYWMRVHMSRISAWSGELGAFHRPSGEVRHVEKKNVKKE